MKKKVVKKVNPLVGYNLRQEKLINAEKKALSMTEWQESDEYRRLKEIEETESRLGFDLSVPKSESISERAILGYSGSTSHNAFQGPTIKPIFGSAK